MPMTVQGFHKLTYAELLEQQIIRAKDLFGQDVDTSEKSVLGKYIRLNVSDFAQQEEALEQIYLARYIDTATGISLDRLTPFACIKRNAATYAVLNVFFCNTGETAVTVPMNTKIVNADGILYHTLEEVTVPPDASQKIGSRIACDTAGTVGNAVSQMTFYHIQIPNVEISYPTIGGTVIDIHGQDTETDDALRARWKKAIFGSGSGTSDAVIGAVSRIEGVRDVVLYENDTDERIQSVGGMYCLLEPHSFAVVVLGGENVRAEIAAAIFEKKPLGIGTSTGGGWNTVTETVTDAAGFSHTICFSYASTVPVCVYVTVSKENEPDFDTAYAKEAFEAALQEYFENYRIGQAAYANTLYAPLIQTGAVYCIDQIELEAIVGDIHMGKKAKLVCGADECFAFDSVVIHYQEDANAE